MLDKIYSTTAFNIKVFVAELNKSSPSRRNFTNAIISQEGNPSLVIVDISFRKNVLSFMKLSKWSK